MNQYILTYWWFGAAGQLPDGLRGGGPRELLWTEHLRAGRLRLHDVSWFGGRTGVAEVAASSPHAAVVQFQVSVGDTNRQEDFLVLSIVDVAVGVQAHQLPTLDIVDRGLFVDGRTIKRSLVDDVGPGTDNAEAHYVRTHGPTGPPVHRLRPGGPLVGDDEWVVTGTITGDDQRYVQKVMAPTLRDALKKVLDWLRDEHSVGPDIAEVWSVVHLGAGGRRRVYVGTSSYRGPGQIETSGESWMRGEFEEVPFPARAPTGQVGHPPGLLERVNRDRARRGQPALAPGEWTTADLEEFAQHLRNPRSAELKRRLMR